MGHASPSCTTRSARGWSSKDRLQSRAPSLTRQSHHVYKGYQDQHLIRYPSTSSTLTKVQLLLIPALVVDIPEERTARRPLEARAGHDHVRADTRTSHAVHLVVDELARRVELGARLAVDGEDVGAFDGGAAWGGVSSDLD